MTTPKDRFLTFGLASGFSNLAKSEAFEPACDYALLQLIYDLTPNCALGSPTDPYVGLDANAQRVGAQRVLEILKHLHEVEVPKPPPQAQTPKLHY